MKVMMTKTVVTVMLLLGLTASAAPRWKLIYEKPGETNVVTSESNPTAIAVELLRTGDQWSGKVMNREPKSIVHSLEIIAEPFKVDTATDAFYIPWSTGGSRIKVWPDVNWKPRTAGKNELAAEFDKEYVPDGNFWVPKGNGIFEIDPRMRMPGVRGGMQFMTVANRTRGFYVGSHDPRFTCKDFTGVYDAKTRQFTLGIKFNLWLRSGDDFVVTPVVFADYAGDWHAAARRYRAWWNRCFRIAYVPDRVKDMTGVMIVLLKQQNDEIIWPYTEFDSLGRCARSYGFDHVEFHAWGTGGHDRLYPEYEPDPLMGGKEGLIRGVKTLREMGIHATVYSNGQLQERGTTEYWRTKGKGGAIVNRDGSEHTETWHKFTNYPAHTFDVVCYYQQAWKDRMLEICRDAKAYGFEGFFYDQIGVSRPRQCFAANHGHRPGDWVYTSDRHDLFKSIADVIHSEDPDFVLSAEGFHDAIFDSCAWFEGWAEEGFAWSRFDKDYVQDFYPEFVLYTFPEVVTTDRSYTPSYDRRQLNGAVVLNLRVNFAIRYRIDRAFVEEGKVPTAQDTQYMISPTDHEAMAKADWAGNRAYMKLVNEWRKTNKDLFLRGTFKADEGFEVRAAGDFVANRWDSEDGRTGILVWNGDMKKAQQVAVKYPGQLLYAEEPEAGKVDASSAIPANTLRLYVFRQNVNGNTVPEAPFIRQCANENTVPEAPFIRQCANENTVPEAPSPRGVVTESVCASAASRGGSGTVLAADAAMAASRGGSGTVSAADAAMATWRCSCENASVVALGEADGRCNVLRFAYPKKPGAKKGSVCVASYDLRPMLGSWIPPYVGARALRFVCSVRTSAVSGAVTAEVRGRANPSWTADKWKVWTAAVPLTSTGADKWASVSVDCALDAYERLADVCFLFEGAGSCQVDVADMRVVLDDGSCHALVNGDMPSYRTGMDKPFAAKPLRAFPKRPRIQFGIGQQWVMEYRDSLGDLGAYMKKYLPEYDIVLSLGGAHDPRLVASMKTAPSNVFFQWQGGQHDLRFAGIKDALVRTKDGRPQSRMFNSSVATHQLFKDAYEDQVAYLGTLGFNNMQRYDYVWYYPEGASGFDAASVAAFREDLLGKDEGLDLVADGRRPARRIRFWEYYADYHGAPLKPKDVGASSWETYEPKLDTPVRDRLHWTLVAYEWLRLAQRFGEWSEKYCFGAPYDFLLNGEFSGNGNDHVYLSRLRTSGVCSPEFFSPALKCLSGYYRGAGRFLRNARACGKSFGVTVETSRGGGGAQPYWSAKTGYTLCYFLSALGFDGFEYDGIPGHCTWAEYASGKNAFNTAELNLGMADARGYRQAKLDGAKPRPSTGIYHVCNRPVAGYRTAYYTDANTAGQYGDFRYELRQAEIDCTQTDPQELPTVLGQAKVVLVSPEVRRDLVDRVLVPWAQKPGHVLVTNKTGCAKWLASAQLPRLQKPAEKGLAPVEVLPFECRQGKVAVLFNRKACAEADREKWYEKVWRPVIYGRTYDPKCLLYFDKVPGAAAMAEVPVARDGAYRVYRMISGREEVVAARDGYLRMELGDDLTDVFYYGADDESYRAFLATVKDERTLTAGFLAD